MRNTILISKSHVQGALTSSLHQLSAPTGYILIHTLKGISILSQGAAMRDTDINNITTSCKMSHEERL